MAFRPGFGAAPATAKSDVDPLLLADIILNDMPQSGVSLQSGVTTNEEGAEVAVSFARSRIPSGYATIREPFLLPPGKYLAKVPLRVAGTNSLGFSRKEFTLE